MPNVLPISERQDAYEFELIARYGKGIEGDIQRTKTLWNKQNQAEQAQTLADLEALESALAEKMTNNTPANATFLLSPLLTAHRGWIAAMWGKPCSLRAYGGLAELYANHPDFRVRYEGYAPGFTDWLTQAMTAYAQRGVQDTRP